MSAILICHLIIDLNELSLDLLEASSVLWRGVGYLFDLSNLTYQANALYLGGLTGVQVPNDPELPLKPA